MNKRRILCLLSVGLAMLVVLIWSRTAGAQQPLPPVHDKGTPLEEAAAQLALRGSVPLIVGLHAPGFDAAMAAGAPEAVVAQAQGQLLVRLAAHNPTNIKTYPYMPHVALTVQSADALAALYADPAVASVVIDWPSPPLLSDTLSILGANYTGMLNYTGEGQTIAVLDTGVDRFHSWMAGKIISEACYSTTNSGWGSTSVCPGGAAASTAASSGVNCASTISGCDHGTHVASIAAAVAPGASLISIQVFSRFTDGGANSFCSDAGRTSPCALTFHSDQLAALQRVLFVHNQFSGINIAAVNMSLGGSKYVGPCVDLGNDYLTAVTALRNARVAVVVAAGNDGYRDSMGSPACISNVVSVGATTKTNLIASYSNLSVFTSLLAPGSNVMAATPANTSDDKSGTSMAAPHVAGAFAVLRALRPVDSVTQLQDLLVSTGVTVPDQRTNGNVDNKRRIYLYGAVCAIVTCDNNDFRTISVGQQLFGEITPASDRDHYFFYATTGGRLTLELNRVASSADLYLELFDPYGTRVAVNNNGGANGIDALINNHTLQHTGRYLIVARTVSGTAGAYTLRASQQIIQSNPAPLISHLSPGAATASAGASSFWVAIHGSNFLPTSQVKWNGSLRTMFYSSSSLIYIRVLGSDIGFSPVTPRNATVSVTNPTPGGGTVYAPFGVLFPFLGASELVHPAAGSTIPTGVQTTMVLSWTVPVTETTWRIMQNMDLRLRDETGRVLTSIRVVERPGAGSVYRLLNEAQTTSGIDTLGTPDEGLPGEARNLVLTDTVTLHLADSAFSGSGLTAIMSPTVTFGPNAVGTWTVEFRVDKTVNDQGSIIQDEDILGQITIVDPACPAAVTGVSLSGPALGMTGAELSYTAAIDPIAATTPVTYTWAPEPASGQGTPNAVFNWQDAGRPVVFVSVENCGGFAADLMEVFVASTAGPNLHVTRQAPAAVLAGEPITHTLTVSNSGAQTATNILVVDTLPAGATYLGGGTLAGNEVTWLLPSLPGFGATAEVTYVISASVTITGSAYRVQADGGINQPGSLATVTRIVDARRTLDPLAQADLSYSRGPSIQTHIVLPAGTVADPTLLTVVELMGPSHPLSSSVAFAGRALALRGYQRNISVPGLALSESISVSLSYDPALAAGGGASPALFWWNGNAWSGAGVSCATQPAQSQVVCAVAAPRATDFILAVPGQTSLPVQVLLPIVKR